MNYLPTSALYLAGRRSVLRTSLDTRKDIKCEYAHRLLTQTILPCLAHHFVSPPDGRTNKMAYLAGIEPTTFGSANQCSIRLSYRYILAWNSNTEIVKTKQNYSVNIVGPIVRPSDQNRKHTKYYLTLTQSPSTNPSEPPPKYLSF